MKDVVALLQNLDALAFMLLGLATGVSWARRRDRSLLWLALAIVLLSAVSILGRIPVLLHVRPPLLPELSLIVFVASGYALLRYRASLIPLPKRWHVIAVVAMTAAGVCFFGSRALAAAGAIPTAFQTGTVIALVVIWSAAVVEPIVRFWLVARGLPAVQAWRLRSLSLGFGGIVAILLFAITVGAAASNAAVQVATQLVVLVIVPLLYISFSPPAWLRREWRASEEEGLRSFMQDLLLLKEDPVELANRALDWAMRLAGGAAAVAFNTDGSVLAVRSLAGSKVQEVRDGTKRLAEGPNRIVVQGTDTRLLVLSLGAGDGGRLVVLAGPFTPDFGGDEISRLQQFMTAVAANLDRARLLVRLKDVNARLVEADKHKSVFLASMSHELRTPLNAILGFSELLMDSPNGQFPEATRTRFLSQIHSSGKHLLGLINDILDLSKVEAGQMELRLQVVSVSQVIEQVVSTIEPLAAQNQIRIEVDAGAAGEIEADAGKLKQMLLNLTSNAIKFTETGGRVTISATRLPDSVEIAVADTGIGIAQSDLSRIFHEFQQLDSGTARQQQGTGLGLSLTKRFAMLHGGDVRARSQVGAGSVFTLRMPLVASRPVKRRIGPGVIVGHDNGDASRPLVLVVEDDPPAAELLIRQLDRAGYRAELASTGAEVMAKAREMQPDVITLDILLPDLDGWEVLNRLKKDDATSGIPVVVISVVDNPELGIALGALDYFVKPVVGNDLINRLGKFTFSQKLPPRELEVLVVDDEEANRDLLAGILEPAGFKVISASGGAEAIELARSRKPDLVLLDLMMPEVNGFDVVQALRSHDATRETPIMVLTAKELTQADKQQLNGQVSNILKRGSTGASDLLALLQEVLADRSPAPVEASSP